MAHEVAGGFVRPAQSGARRRRAIARPHDDSLRVEPWQREHARDDEHAGDFRGRRFQARPARRVRHAAQLSAAESLCLDAATPGPGDRPVRLRHRHHARARDGVIAHRGALPSRKTVVARISFTAFTGAMSLSALRYSLAALTSLLFLVPTFALAV